MSLAVGQSHGVEIVHFGGHPIRIQRRRNNCHPEARVVHRAKDTVVRSAQDSWILPGSFALKSGAQDDSATIRVLKRLLR